MKPKRILFAILVVLVIMPSLCGCLHAASVEDFGFVLTLGVDVGEQYAYNISFFMQNEGSVSESQSESSHIVVTCEGESLFDAITIAEASLPYRLNFAHVSYIVMSQALAESGMIKEFFSVSFGMLRIRTSANLLVCQESAKEFLNGLQYSESINVSKLEESLIEMHATNGVIPLMSLGEFLSSIADSRYDAVLPLCGVDFTVASEGDSKSSTSSSSSTEQTPSPSNTPDDTTDGVQREGGMPSYAWGGAIFNNEIMVGVLTASEVQMLLLAQGRLGGAFLSYSRADGTKYIIRIESIRKPMIRVETEPVITLNYDIRISARLELETSQKIMQEMRERGSLAQDMKYQIISDIEQRILTVFIECRDLDCDAFGVGKHVSMQFTSSRDWECFDFASKLRDCYVAPHIEIELEDVYVASYMD